MKAEFSVENTRQTNLTSPVRWIVSHVLAYKKVLILAIIGIVGNALLSTLVPVSVGRAFDAVLENPANSDRLTEISVALIVIVLVRGVADLLGSFSSELLARRLERDARDELYRNLLGKSQTFHNRQRVGDLMARAANDVRQLSMMLNPGVNLIFESIIAIIMPLIMIAFIDLRLLVPPLVFVVLFVLALRLYMRQLTPVSIEMRGSYGNLNARLAEAITGIEVVKTTAQENEEMGRFSNNARAYRNAAVQQGKVQAKYLPTLLLVCTLAASLLLGLYFVSEDELSIGQLVAYLGLIQSLRFPTFISIFTFSLVQLGVASSDRILDLINEESDMDENTAGYEATIEGDIVFDDVSLSLGGEPILDHVSFHAKPGETVAIVGETGSGKTTLTKLVNRIYDVDSGRVLIDNVDVRDWSMDSLRSQISVIEQNIVLFPRPIAENIAFSTGQQANIEAVRMAARDAQAEDFILHLPEGYDTVIGERGVTLSGGQRQRIAIARALLTDPRILIIDDSTSAVDSATEDRIQRAISRVLEGRTTLLITHRLSQIRRADKIIVLRKGHLVAQGTHEELLASSDVYRRIFAPYQKTESPDPIDPIAA